MVDLRRHARLARDCQQLLDGLEKPIPLGTHVRDVASAVLTGGLVERDQLVCPGVERRRIDQRRADAESSLAHGRANEFLHALELRLRRGPVLVTDLVYAKRRGADVRGDVRTHAPRLEEFQVLSERGPGHGEFVVLCQPEPLAHGCLAAGCPDPRLHRGFLHRVVQGAVRVALAEDLERDPLTDVALRPSVRDEAVGRPAEHVDEAGSHGQSGHIDFRGAFGVAEITDRGNPVAVDGDVADEGIAAAAVIDRAAAENEVVADGLARAAGNGDSEEDGKGERSLHGTPAPGFPRAFGDRVVSARHRMALRRPGCKSRGRTPGA